MGEILGIGLTHQPTLSRPLEYSTIPLKRILKDPGLEDAYRHPDGWPEGMRREWGNDEGMSAVGRHQDAVREWYRKVKQALDDFAPDFLLIWGDDQYENFKEDIIPQFCILAYESFEAEPWKRDSIPNAWGEPKETKFTYQGHQQGAKYLATALIEQGFDVAYAYKPLHYDLGHAFRNVPLYFDLERQGFSHRIVPFQVNSYGRRVIVQTGGIPNLANPPSEGDLDPPSPPPWRCFDIGGATARALARSPWRVALIASGSWSHPFLSAKTHWLYPDIDADRVLYDALEKGDYRTWRDLSLASMEESGQQEVLNWMCLVGAMAELDRRPDECGFLPTYIGSNKSFAIFQA